MQRRRIAYVIFLFLVIHKLIFNDAVIFKMTNVVCESYNKSFVVINKCRLHAISRNKIVFNFNGTILHPCSDIIIDMQIFKRANGYKPWLYKFNIDACRFTKKMYNPAMILIYNLFKEFSNLNHTCPYVGDQIIEGFYLRADLLGLIIPTGDYLLNITWIFDKKKTFITNVYYVFEEDL